MTVVLLCFFMLAIRHGEFLGHRGRVKPSDDKSSHAFASRETSWGTIPSSTLCVMVSIIRWGIEILFLVTNFHDWAQVKLLFSLFATEMAEYATNDSKEGH